MKPSTALMKALSWAMALGRSFSTLASAAATMPRSPFPSWSRTLASISSAIPA